LIPTPKMTAKKKKDRTSRAVSQNTIFFHGDISVLMPIVSLTATPTRSATGEALFITQQRDHQTTAYLYPQLPWSGLENKMTDRMVTRDHRSPQREDGFEVRHHVSQSPASSPLRHVAWGEKNGSITLQNQGPFAADRADATGTLPRAGCTEFDPTFRIAVQVCPGNQIFFLVTLNPPNYRVAQAPRASGTTWHSRTTQHNTQRKCKPGGSFP